MPTPVFRLASPKDIVQLIDLRVFMQEEVNNITETQGSSDYREKLRSYFAQAIPAGTYSSAVAEIDGKIVAANGLVSYEKPPSLTGGIGKVGYVSNVYTHPKWRGQGIATTLMQFLIEHARQMGIDKRKHYV